jgi:ferric-dicitrate binding protein FerR (iron transport regulator)
MSQRPPDDPAEHRAELERLARQGDVFSTAVPRETLAPGSANDPAELWGRRIGRGLAIAVFVFLLFWLARTYL